MITMPDIVSIEPGFIARKSQAETIVISESGRIGSLPITATDADLIGFVERWKADRIARR